MKKILIAVMLLFMLTACTLSGNVSVPKTDVPYNSTTQKDFELVFSSYRQGNVVVYYPRIEGFYDADKQDRLNEEILNDAKKVIALFGDDIVCITVDYEVVTKSDEKIVIEYTGHGCTTPECDREETVSYVSNIIITETQSGNK